MITPIQHVKRLENNTNNVHVLTFNDQMEYVVKFHLLHHRKALVNEWLAYCLAKYLQLPIPASKIVEIPRDAYLTIPELHDLPYVKHHIALQYKMNRVNGHSASTVNEIVNNEQLAGIIALDYWLCNTDRTRKNILLKEISKNQYHLSIIDQAKCFGATSWTVSDLENLPEGILESSTHQMMARFITNEVKFKEQLEIIQAIPTLLIDEILSFIPECWMLTKEERKAIVKTLKHRKYKVLPNVLNEFVANVYLPEVGREK
jgi:hypothetical protein